MKRFIVSLAFTLTIIILYQFIDINLFTIDFPRRVSSELFKSLRYDPGVETEIVLLDIEYTPLDTVKTYIEILETLEPKYIGVNLCNINDKSEVLNNYLRQSKKIVTCDCKPNSDHGTSRITTKNKVSHFKADKDSYFEFQFTDKENGLNQRKNEEERINFRGVNRYFNAPLHEIKNIDPETIKNKTILVGFLRDSLITPMNDWYNTHKEIPGDMSDAQISANIISTITRNEFINEVNPLFRVSIVLVASLLCTGLIRLVRTKYNVLNIVFGLAILILLNGMSCFIIVYAFSKNYYLELHEMTIVLIISTIISFYWNTKQRFKKKPEKGLTSFA